MDTFVWALSRLCRFFLYLAASLTLVLVIVVVQQVFARYIFGDSSVAMQELSWHLFGGVFLLSGGGALLLNKHVRVDVLHRYFPQSYRVWIDRLGFIFFLMPTCVCLVWFGTEFSLASRSFSTSSFSDGFWVWLFSGERSADSGGLPGRWIVKSLIPLGSITVFLSGLVLFLESFTVSIGGRSNG